MKKEIDKPHSASKIATLFSDGMLLCLKEAQKHYDNGFDLDKAANCDSNSDIFKEQFFRIYQELIGRGALVEAYCLLRMAFGQITTTYLLQLWRESDIITESMAYEAAKHDKDNVPF